MKNQAVYLLTIEDVQNVAKQEIGRNLSFQEIEKIKDIVAEKINWYDVIADSISERIKPKGRYAVR